MASHSCPVAPATDTKQLIRHLSHQNSENVVSEELEMLSNVYFEELEILQSESGEATELKLHLTPSTGDDKQRQYVYLDLRLSLPPSYPLAPAQLTILQSRGLSDPHLRGIQEGVALRARELVGVAMVYELAEFARDCLTDYNRPCGQCTLCQFDFQEEDEFTKTECYHYFHVACLARYVSYHRQLGAREGEGRREGRGHEREIKPKLLECPVCRETIAEDSCPDVLPDPAHRGPDPAHKGEVEFVFTPSQSLRQWQRKMAALLQQQRERGGVIDGTEKDDVIDLTWVSRRTQDQALSGGGGGGGGGAPEERKAVKEETGRVRATERAGEARQDAGSLEDWLRDTASEQGTDLRTTSKHSQYSTSRYPNSSYPNSRHSNPRGRPRHQQRQRRTGERGDQPPEKRVAKQNGTRRMEYGNGRMEYGSGRVGVELSETKETGTRLSTEPIDGRKKELSNGTSEQEPRADKRRYGRGQRLGPRPVEGDGGQYRVWSRESVEGDGGQYRVWSRESEGQRYRGCRQEERRREPECGARRGGRGGRERGRGRGGRERGGGRKGAREEQRIGEDPPPAESKKVESSTSTATDSALS